MKQTAKKLLIAVLAMLTFASCKQASNIQELQSQYVQSPSGKIHYKTYGSKTPALVFVHGFGCDINAWSEQFAYFANKNQMVFIDLPGYGSSEKPNANYTLDFYADAVAAVLDTLGIKNPVLVGHSLGTPVCRRVIQTHPQLNAKLCDIDGVYCFYPTDSTEYAAYKAQINEFVGSFNNSDGQYKQRLDGFISYLFIPSSPKSVKNYATATMGNTPSNIASSTMVNLVNEKYWDKSPIAAPTLVLCSKNSQIPENNKALMQALYPNLNYEEWSHTGHFMMMEDPVRFNKALDAFANQTK